MSDEMLIRVMLAEKNNLLRKIDAINGYLEAVNYQEAVHQQLASTNIKNTSTLITEALNVIKKGGLGEIIDEIILKNQGIRKGYIYNRVSSMLNLMNKQGLIKKEKKQGTYLNYELL